MIKATKTSELTGPALDWAVAKCEGIQVKWSAPHEQHLVVGHNYHVWQPHKNWAQGGPIIERERIETIIWKDGWSASYWGKGDGHMQDGPTPLIAAMRCYVASKLGDEVDVPEELT